MTSLNSNKYRYGIGLVTVGSLVSARFGAGKIGDILEKQRTDLFLNKEVALDIVDGHHRCFCIQKLANSGQSGAEWASQPIRMIFFHSNGLPASHRSRVTRTQSIRKRYDRTGVARHQPRCRHQVPQAKQQDFQIELRRVLR